MELLLLDQEPETEIPDLRFPKLEPFSIAVYECRIYDRWRCLIRVIPAKTIGECLAEVYTEPTYRERLKGIIPMEDSRKQGNRNLII